MRRGRLSKEKVIEVAGLLAEDDLNYPEIAELTEVNVATVRNIANRSSYLEWTAGYDFADRSLISYNDLLDDGEMRLICVDLSNLSNTLKEVSAKYNVPVSFLRRIMNGEVESDIVQEFIPFPTRRGRKAGTVTTKKTVTITTEQTVDNSVFDNDFSIEEDYEKLKLENERLMKKLSVKSGELMEAKQTIYQLQQRVDHLEDANKTLTEDAKKWSENKTMVRNSLKALCVLCGDDEKKIETLFKGGVL